MVTLLEDFYRGKRVFVTGHTGFKGSWMCKMLANASAIVTGYSLAPNTNPSLFEIAELEKDIHSVIGDIRDYVALKKDMEKYGQSMLERFQAYWAAPVNGTTTLLWETKKSWSVSYRLKSWSKSHQELEAQVSEIRLERTRKKSAPQAGNDEGQKLLAAQREEANARLEQEIRARKEGAVSYEEYIRRKNKTTT